MTAKVVGYRNEVLSHYKIKPRTLAATTEDELYELQHSMDLTLVSDVTVSPSASVSLFNHPSSTVRRGCRFFYFAFHYLCRNYYLHFKKSQFAQENEIGDW